MPNTKKSISAAQRKKDPHAGPHGSFPLDAEHLKAAWDLAGHAANPAAVRAKILAFARSHGMMNLLPKTAQGNTAKAKNADVEAILTHAYHASVPDSYARRQLLRLSADRGLLNKLPPDAHTDMHAMSIPHQHPSNDGIVPRFHGENEGDIQEDPDDPAYPMMHDHVVTKAFNPKATTGSIVKSWTVDGSDDLLIEGWMSTPRRDLEKDITEPEAFKDGPLKDYFSRSAPLSLEHGTDSIPVGHLTHAAILRDGKVLEHALHPSGEQTDFSALPNSGSGVWVRALITEEPAKSAIRKGNVGGMSFIGNFTQYEPLPGGGKRYRRIDPLLESTVAAYPVNPDAAFRRVQKALGYTPEEQGESPAMDEELDLIAMLTEAAERAQAKTQAEESVQKGITAEQFADILAQFEARLNASVDEKVQKALVPVREEGVGRKGGATATGPTLEDDPVHFLIQKATNLKDDEDLTIAEKNLAGKLFSAALAQGMVEDGEE